MSHWSNQHQQIIQMEIWSDERREKVFHRLAFTPLCLNPGKKVGVIVTRTAPGDNADLRGGVYCLFDCCEMQRAPRRGVRFHLTILPLSLSPFHWWPPSPTERKISRRSSARANEMIYIFCKQRTKDAQVRRWMRERENLVRAPFATKSRICREAHIQNVYIVQPYTYIGVIYVVFCAESVHNSSKNSSRPQDVRKLYAKWDESKPAQIFNSKLEKQKEIPC